MKKNLILGMAAAAATLAVSAVAVSAEPVEVELWHYFDQSADSKAIVEWVDEYNSMQEDIHITATYVSRDELMNQYTVGALSGELPDIGMVDSPDMASYISLGVFEDITAELEEWGELDMFYEGPLSSCMDSEGNLYGLPQNSNCLALACNMDALEAAGYDHMPTSLAELQEMAEACTDADSQTYGFAMSCISTEEGTFQILPWLRGTQNGAERANVSDLTAESAVTGLTALANMVNNGSMSKECINWNQSDVFNQFASGKAAMAEIGTWHLAQTDTIAGFNYDFCLLPTGDEGTSSSTIGGENFGVCTGAENKEACVEFLKWMCSKEKSGEWGVVAGKIPTRTDATADYDYEQDGFAVFTEEMNYADARGPHPEWPSISEAIYSAVQSVVVDGADPAEALAGAMETITPIIEETPLPETE